MNMMFLFIILDLNVLFNYTEPHMNHYYLEACKHYEFYTQALFSMSKHHSLSKLQAQKEESYLMDTTEIQD